LCNLHGLCEGFHLLPIKKENQKKTTADSKKQVTLPKTNENKSVVELVAGVIIVLLTGVIFFWKKRKVNKE